MATNDPSGPPGGAGGGRYQIALSYAEEDRDYVGKVAAALDKYGIRYFDERAEPQTYWGKYRSEEIAEIYNHQTDHVVLFISQAYVSSLSTTRERRLAVGLMDKQREPFVLPARFDKSEVPGLPTDVVPVELAGFTPEEFAGIINGWLNGNGSPLTRTMISEGLRAGWGISI